MGLSLRDLQEALYHLLGSVLSVSAINRVTLKKLKAIWTVIAKPDSSKRHRY